MGSRTSRPLWRAGAAYFKAFTCATHGVPAVAADRLLELAESLGELGAVCLVHCEDDLMTAANERRLREAMRTDGGIVPEWRSREAELVAVGTVAVIARMRDARLVIAHASNADVLDVVALEQARGSPLRAESCPQYLHLREDEVLTEGAFRKFTPPARIRSLDDEQAMWSAFQDGRVHVLSSDHAPATREQKQAGTIWEVHFGLPGIDTTLALMLDAALAGRVALERVVDAYATAPAQQYGLARKGRLEPGFDADMALVDPDGGLGDLRRHGRLAGRLDAVRGPSRARARGAHAACAGRSWRRRVSWSSRRRRGASCPARAPSPRSPVFT